MSLVAHWTFDGTTKDRVGGYGGGESVTYVDGKIGQGIDVDGTQVRTSSSNDGIQSAFTGNQMSLAFWLREYDHNTYRWNDIFGMDGTRFERGRGDNGNPAGDYWCNLGTGDSAISGRENNVFQGDIGQPGNEWFHVVIRRAGDDYAVYINGERDTSCPVTGPMDISGDFIINEDAAGAEIDDVRLYDHAISEKKIKQLSQAKVLHYKFTGETDAVGDLAGYGHSGKRTGTTYVDDTPIGSHALEFDGNDDYIAVRNLVYDTAGSIPELTLTAWVKVTGDGVIHSWDRSEFWRFGVGGSTGSSSVDCGFKDDNGIHDLAGNTIVTDGSWHHVVFKYDNGDVTFYVDGSPDKTYTTGGSAIGANLQRYGFVGDYSETSQFDDAGGGGFSGSMDDVRIYHHALSDDEVKDIYEQRASIDSGGNFHSHELSEEVDNGLKLNIESAGYNVGNFSKLIVNGNDIGAKGRGINALEIDSSGNQVKTESFDVYGSSTTESNNLVDFIDTATSGNILMFAEDDHAGNVEQNAITALQELGSSYIDDVSNDGRSSWAFICIKGGGTYGEEFAPSGNGPVYVEHIFPDSFTISTTGVASAQLNEVGPAPASLVGWWPLDGDVRDHSGNGNHGTNNGASVTSGLGQSAYDLDRSNNNEISLSDLGINGNVSLSLTVWHKLDSNQSHNRDNFFGFGGHSGNDSFSLRYNGDTQLRHYFYGNDLVVSVPNMIGDWHFSSVIYDSQSNTRKIYFDGSLVGSDSPESGINMLNEQHSIGGFNNEHFGGKIQDVRIYDRALSDTEVETLYNLTDTTQPQRVIQTDAGELYASNQFSERL